jgi:molybdopterin-guanine dinucleotide biosynthesis protein A
VLVCAADLPFVTTALLRELAQADPGGAPAVLVAGPGGALEPLLGCYQPAARARLAPAAAEASAPLRAVVAGLAPRRLTVSDPGVLFNVNTPQDLADAAARLARLTRSGRYPKVKS